MGAAPSKEERRFAPNSYPLSFSNRLLSSISPITTRCDAPPPPPALPLPPPPLPDGKGSDSSSSSVPPPPPPAAEDSIENAALTASAYINPGSYEQMQMESRRLVALDTYDGFRCDINKQLSPYMGVVHNFWLGTNMIPDGRKRTYAFITQVANESGMLMARVDPERGSVDGRIHAALFGGAMMSKIVFGVSQEGQTDQCMAEVDFGAQTWSGNLKYGSMGGGILCGCNYFQAITPKLAMGADGIFIAANQALVSNYFLKYTMPAKTGEEDSELKPAKKPQNPNAPPSPDTEGSSTFYANYNTGQSMVGLSYKRVVTPNRVTLGADLQCSPQNLEGELALGAEFKLTRSRVHIGIDGNGRIQSVVEAKLGMVAGSPQINFSADVNFFADGEQGKEEQLRFGYGINFEG